MKSEKYAREKKTIKKITTTKNRRERLLGPNNDTNTRTKTVRERKIRERKQQDKELSQAVLPEKLRSTHESQGFLARYSRQLRRFLPVKMVF